METIVDRLTSQKAISVLTEIVKGIIGQPGKTAIFCVKNGHGMKVVPINFEQNEFARNGEILAQQALTYCTHCTNEYGCHPATLQTGGISLIIIGMEKYVDVDNKKSVETVKDVGEFCLIYFAYKMGLLTKQEALAIDNWFTKFFI